ncbi:kinase-like domain-containing protein [Mycena vitilis]|nr:kinase-like domain-containing protein [Mycena vitilis]
MGFIRDHTSVPVPAVRCVYKYGKVTYIKMDFLPGKEAYIIWDRMPSADQQSVLAELESYVRQIRSLVPPSPGLVASVDGGSCWDHRIGTRRAGPFSNHDDFHRFLRLDSDLSRWDDDNDRDKMVVDSHSQKYLSKFTHGDLVPRNVLVHEGRISAIIDWDCAGWRPEYWESTKARFAPLGTPEVWFDALDRACGDPYTPQLKGEYRLWEAAECPSTPVQTVVNGRWM